MEEMRSIRQGVEGAFQAASEVFSKSDQNQALRLIHEGRDIAQKSDALIEQIARRNLRFTHHGHLASRHSVLQTYRRAPSECALQRGDASSQN